MSITAMDLVAAAKQNITEVSTSQSESGLGDMLVLDVRELEEFEAGFVPGAINIPRGVLEFKIDNHPAFKDKQNADILVYCQSGGRSALATEALNKLGYTNAVSMAGGFKNWMESGYSVSKDPAAW
ncbi:MAG: rhodanese-like domain-containing protein [Methylococcales bacterium]